MLKIKNYIIKILKIKILKIVVERVVWCSVIYCVEMEVFINESVNFRIKIMKK